MAVSTTQSIWRSGGGDQTRTAYCGSGIMAARFFITDPSPPTSNVLVTTTSSVSLILPENSIVIGIYISNPGSAGTCDIGVKGYYSGTVDSNFIANALPISAKGTFSTGSVINGFPITEMSYVTVTDDGSGASGTVGGTILYYVLDPLTGQQNV